MSDNALRLRPATTDDVAAILSIRPAWTEFAVRALLDAVANTPAVEMFIAEAPGEGPVATIQIAPCGTAIVPLEGVGYSFNVPAWSGIAWFDDLHVKPSAQARGVGVATMTAALAEARRLGFRRVEGRTATALPHEIVDRLGATDLGAIDLPDGSVGHYYGRDL